MSIFTKLALIAVIVIAIQWYVNANRPAPVVVAEDSQTASISRVNSDGSTTVLWTR